MKKTIFVFAIALFLLLYGVLALTVTVLPSFETDAALGTEGDIADDPAIWIHPTDGSLSLVIGANKDSDGGIEVYDLNGKRVQKLGSDGFNNVDLRYGFSFKGEKIDLALVTNRDDSVLEAYKVNSNTRRLEQIGRISVSGMGELYGFCMYKSPKSGKYYGFVTDKDGNLKQYEIFESNGEIKGSFVRSFSFSTDGVEGCVADDFHAKLYVGEEDRALWRFGAEPSDGSDKVQIGRTGDGNLKADIEGVSIYYSGEKSGYLIASSQGSSSFVVYDRESNKHITNFRIGSNGNIDSVSDTDGIEVTNFPIGGFSKGLFVAHDGSNSGSSESNFKFVKWEEIALKTDPKLDVNTNWDPRRGFSNNTGNQTNPPINNTQPPTNNTNQTNPGNNSTQPPQSTSDFTLQLKLFVISSSQINLEWNDINGERNYIVERSVDNANWEDIARLGKNVLSYKDKNLESGKLYYYKVRAVTSSSNIDYDGIGMEMKIDDGAVVYINGDEIYRYNLPFSSVNYKTRANDYIEDSWQAVLLRDDLLKNGNNVLAVEIHQFSDKSSDISFDLALYGIDNEDSDLIFSKGSLWKYNDKGFDLGTTWKNENYDDESWSSGNGELGYGDGDEATIVDDGPDSKYITTYFRKTFNLNNDGSSVQSNVVSGIINIDNTSSNTNNSTNSFNNSIVYSSPIVITKGGIYYGNWESLDVDVPAVTIKTSERVTIENSNIRSKSDLIYSRGYDIDLIVRNTKGYALNPNDTGEHPGRFLRLEGFKNVKVENNYFEGTSGMKLSDYGGNYSSDETVKILRNKAKNIDGRHSDGRGGFSNTKRYTAQFFQIDGAKGLSNAEIAWNEIINEPYKSRPEDVINLFRSGGKSSSYFLIHDNYIQGAYPALPESQSFAGGGIMLHDGSSSRADSGYVKAFNNQVVSVTNYGIAIASGHDNEIYNNRVVSSGKLSDGTKIEAQNVGIYIWNFHRERSSLFYNNFAHDNLVGNIGEDGDRNDYWLFSCASGKCVNNENMPDPITLDTEKKEFEIWKDKVSKESVIIGPYSI